MSSQAVEPLPHVGPEGGQVARRNEETTFTNYPETVWGREFRPMEAGAGIPRFLTIEGSGSLDNWD